MYNGDIFDMPSKMADAGIYTTFKYYIFNNNYRNLMVYFNQFKWLIQLGKMKKRSSA